MADLTKAQEELKRDLERVVLSLAARPRGLRGPFPLDNDRLEQTAAAICSRRAALASKRSDQDG